MRRKISRAKSLGPNQIRAWRKAKNLTLERLVERVREFGQPLTVASLGRIETGQQPYTQRTLEGIAKALGCEPADLVGHRPRSPEDVELWTVIEGIQPDQRKRAIQVLRALVA